VTTPDPAIHSVHIVGTGLIGTSLGLALRRIGIDVSLSDRDDGALGEAIDLGAGRRREAHDQAPDVVVAATPPARVGEVLADAGRTWPDATLTHVASVQSQTQIDALNTGAPADRLVGGHPMAGREVSGPQGGRADLFDDRVWVVCPAPGCEPKRTQQVRELARICGARPFEMSVADHDAAVAVISHAPQVLASALAGRLVDAPDDVIVLSGQGLRDMTRIAGSSPQLWEEILRWNAASVSAVLTTIVEDLRHLIDDLAGSGDFDQTRELLSRGVIGQARIPGKHGGRDGDYEVVSVMVKDEPGQLASLFVAAGDLGINLEDVRIEHVLGRPSGLIDLSVKPQVIDRLREGLTRQGFDVRS
jgi:prephenate dehydrogenase